MDVNPAGATLQVSSFLVIVDELLKHFSLYFIEFCYPNCNWEKEQTCPGKMDPKTGEQISADYCMPNKNGECAAHCPQQCGEKDMMCPGKTHADGCKDPEYCVSGSKLIFIYNLGKGHSLEQGVFFEHYMYNLALYIIFESPKCLEYRS